MEHSFALLKVEEKVIVNFLEAGLIFNGLFARKKEDSAYAFLRDMKYVYLIRLTFLGREWIAG